MVGLAGFDPERLRTGWRAGQPLPTLSGRNGDLAQQNVLGAGYICAERILMSSQITRHSVAATLASSGVKILLAFLYPPYIARLDVLCANDPRASVNFTRESTSGPPGKFKPIGMRTFLDTL